MPVKMRRLYGVSQRGMGLVRSGWVCGWVCGMGGFQHRRKAHVLTCGFGKVRENFGVGPEKLFGGNRKENSETKEQLSYFVIV